MVKKDTMEVVVIFIIILVFAAMVVLFLINTGLTSKLLGSMPWITSGILALLGFLGWKVL